MPPLQPVPNVIKATHFGHVGSKPWNVIFHYRYSGTVPPMETVQSFANEFQGDGSSFWPAQMTADRTYEGCRVIDLSSSMGNEAESIVLHPGTKVGGALPANVCFMGGWPILRHYRGGHPRTYLPFGDDTDVLNPQFWKDASVGAFGDALFSVQSARIGSTTDGTTIVTGCQVSYFHGEDESTEKPIPRIPPLVDDIINSGPRNSARIRTQRRRLGRGA